MRNKTWILGLALAVWGCDGGEMPGFENVDCDDFDTANCVRVEGGDAQGLLDAVNTIDSDTTIVLGAGTFGATTRFVAIWRPAPRGQKKSCCPAQLSAA